MVVASMSQLCSGSLKNITWTPFVEEPVVDICMFYWHKPLLKSGEIVVYSLSENAADSALLTGNHTVS